ncbi:MAG: hypothetical protein GYB53_14270 [Rhodobacteraceae bacterium]|nr:hypothetical protein [Paracoccaceae bacterium]MBR9823634.1 hypothetical protein [Paracoccaceae bacterium]
MDNIAEEEARLRKAVERVERQVRDIAEDLESVQDRVRAGELTAAKDAVKLSGEIRYWIRFALEMEAKLDEGRERNTTGRGEDIDLDAARASIGCRLDRLRRCGCAEAVSR